jgi:2-dehydro-3-deoxyphosphogalactonate aldolase
MKFSDFSPPLVAILRGLPSEDAPWVGDVLYGAGFRILEVPLNRPGAIAAIGALAARGWPDALVGGGTMLDEADVDAVHAAGGRMLVAPNCNPAVIRRAAALGMLCAPGIATPSEAFIALDAGAHALKLFPAEAIGLAGLAALRATLPENTDLWPVGGVTAASLAEWVKAGATGFGIGSALYRPGVGAVELAATAQAFMTAWRQAQAGSAPGA